MSTGSGSAKFTSSDAYEMYMGRWSRLVAPVFLEWLAIPSSSRWLDVGSGTGELTQTILSDGDPTNVHGVEPSTKFVEQTKNSIRDLRTSFEVGNAQSLPVESTTYDAVVSGLVLNFIPDVNQGIAEMVRVAASGGTVAAYVWDYAGKMEIMRQFWDVAVGLDPEAAKYDEGQRRPQLCRPEALTNHFTNAGLNNVQVRSIDVEAHFDDFDDYWDPFMGGQGSAPGYVMSLGADSRNTLREQLRSTLPLTSDGSMDLIARAWAVKGTRRGL